MEGGDHDGDDDGEEEEKDKIKWNETSLIVNKLSRQRCGHRRR